MCQHGIWHIGLREKKKLQTVEMNVARIHPAISQSLDSKQLFPGRNIQVREDRAGGRLIPPPLAMFRRGRHECLVKCECLIQTSAEPASGMGRRKRLPHNNTIILRGGW